VRSPPAPLGCDTLAALPPVTAEGVTIFGKNSDRHPWECQRLVLVPAADHASGGTIRCQYLEIPQVRRTARVLGSQPYWLWGFEHGVNEHGVAVGNEMVATREPVPARGLLGMDLVRLGLERGRTADETVAVITDLVETHGQGGSGQPHVDWGYHNSFLVCDARCAWIVETSGRHWAVRDVRECAAISNHLSIGADWERLDADAVAFAVAQGWHGDRAGRLDFAGVYRDRESFPPHVSEGRQRRAAALLAAGRGGITGTGMRAILRDHYGSPVYRGGGDPATAEYWSLCMHAGDLMSTTASMVVALEPDRGPITAWVAIGSPCVSIYLPYFLDGALPEAVGRGGKDASPDAPWWAFRSLLTHVENAPDGIAAEVRAYWDGLEREVEERTRQIVARVGDLEARGDRAGAAALLTDFMERNVRAMLAGLSALGAPVTAPAGVTAR
jgi:dipeptidase